MLEHHNGSSRRGVYVDPAFTRNAAAGIHLDFSTPIEGVVNAQPLFLDGHGFASDLVLVVTEKNQVFAIDASSGVVIWRRTLNPPLPRQLLLDSLGPCGTFDPIGISGTPVIDDAAGRIYLDLVTADDRRYAKHLLYALSLDDGSTVPGWPVDIGSSVPGFVDIVQSQRGALTLLNGRVYVPYGSYTDCGEYRGWLVGVSTSDPASVGAWRPEVPGGGIWAQSGVASDGSSLFVATGNTTGKEPDWGGGEAILRFKDGPTFSGLSADYFVPADWPVLDAYDQDLGASGVILFDLPGEGSIQLAAALGKDAKIYLVDRSNLGGIDGALLAQPVTNFVIITTPSAYATAQGTYLVFSGFGYVIGCPGGENVSSVRINTSPLSISTAWCASAPGLGSTIVTTSDGTSESIVWVVGASGDNVLYGFDAETGALIAQAEGASEVVRYTAPIAAKGRIYVAGTDRLYSFAIK